MKKYKIINKNVQQDFYDIISHKLKKISITIIPGEEYWLVIKNNKTTRTSYPYENRDDLEKDYKTIRKIISKLSNEQ